MFTYKKKIFIDRTFGIIAAYVMRGLTKAVGYMLKRDHSLPDDPQVIVVAKIVGLGSILYTGILCRAIKEKFPRSKLVYVSNQGAKVFVSHMNYVDEILTVNDKGMMALVTSTLSVVLKLWRYRPVLYFDMEVYSSWSAILATLSLALNRYGFYRKNAEFKKGMHTHMVFFNTMKHISQVYGQMALCIRTKPTYDLTGILTLTKEDKELCSKVLETSGIIDLPIILFNPNTSDLLVERQWPREKWIDYIEQAVYTCPQYNYLLIGAPHEAEYVSSLYNALSQNAKEKVFNMSGRLSVGSLLALIEKAVLLVTSDSGPLHFAVALGTPTLSIWGPGAPDHYAPMSGPHKIIYKPVYCSPCLYHADSPPCGGNNICVREISVHEVLKETIEILDAIKGGTQNIEYTSSLFHLKNRGSASSSLEEREFNPVVTHRES
jgi:ADP-heptose:LPS heptosyltransferase